MKDMVRNFMNDEQGAPLIEWAIIIAIVAVLGGIVWTIGGTIKAQLDQSASAIGGLDLSNLGDGG